MKKMKLLCLLLSLLVLLPMISACGNATGAPQETTVDETSEPTTEPENQEKEYKFKNANYKNRDFGALIMTATENFYIFSGDHSAPVDEAVYRRNTAVEEKYNVNLVYYPKNGYNAGKHAFNAEIRNNESSGGGLYSLYMGQTFYTHSLIVEGMYYDILQSKVLNLDAPWWDGVVNDTLEISGKLYSSLGSFNAGQLTSMMGVFYNKVIYENYDIGAVVENKSIYDVVRDKEWTFEVMETMTKQMNDLEGMYGMLYHLHGIYCMLPGSNVQLVSKDTDGNLSILGLYTDHFVDVFENYFDYYNNNTGVKYFSGAPDMVSTFAANNTLFMIQEIASMGSGVLAESGLTYGILPFPMYTTEQGVYRTNTQNMEIIQVSGTCNTEMACVLLEYLHYQSRKEVIPTYFEEKLQYRMADQPDDAEMLQLLRDTLYYDFGTLYTTEIGNVWEAIRSLVEKKNSNVASWWAGLENGQVPQGLLDEFLYNYSQLS